MSEQWAPPEQIALIVRRTNQWLDDATYNAESILSSLREIRSTTDSALGSMVPVDDVSGWEETSDEVKDIAIIIEQVKSQLVDLT
ncbi:hypothetical protein QN355_19795 [Cryobacterium sp. 10S3]|uniref:hypothetical protein n=1 Tax=Cryobacterium sp. 10S3 TaxID=3048582 RepID=UPI002AC9095D|nr:hypothetical protein [Cryobacterium sp. 10S3]MEB0288775.1 hypothetical protein [Cryobacterium sp. 10S3]WPX14205.1 hypothetical protein RHM57_02180 [Cryobacterium sp. 10S3]